MSPDRVELVVTRTLKSKRAIAGTGALGIVAIFALGLAIDTPAEPGAILYAVPVVLVALAFGALPGTAAGLVAGGLFWIASQWHGTGLSLLSSGYRVLTLTLLGLATGAVAGRLATSQRELTEIRTRAAEELRRSESRLAEAQRIAHVGSWEWDVPADAIIWSDELYRIWGVDPDDFQPTYASYLELMHADDREVANAAVQEAFARHEPFSFRHRVVRPDGTVRTVESAGAVFLEGGQVVRMTGVGHDVTERVEAEEAYAAAAAEVALQQQLRSRAVELNDAVVQGLAVTRYLLAAGDREGALGAVSSTLERAKELVSDLIGDVELEAGALRRGRPADAPE